MPEVFSVTLSACVTVRFVYESDVVITRNSQIDGSFE